jgi:hypothetical protein
MAVGERIIQNDCSRLGLRMVHVVRYGKPVEIEAYYDQVPFEALETVRVMRRHENDLDMYHLYLMWKARELVKLQVAQRTSMTMAVWWIGKVDGRPVGLRAAAGQAACVYELGCGCWPDTAWVKELPAGATETFEIFDGQRLRLEQVDWGLSGFVMVGRSNG